MFLKLNVIYREIFLFHTEVMSMTEVYVDEKIRKLHYRLIDRSNRTIF